MAPRKHPLDDEDKNDEDSSEESVKISSVGLTETAVPALSGGTMSAQSTPPSMRTGVPQPVGGLQPVGLRPVGLQPEGLQPEGGLQPVGGLQPGGLPQGVIAVVALAGPPVGIIDPSSSLDIIQKDREIYVTAGSPAIVIPNADEISDFKDLNCPQAPIDDYRESLESNRSFGEHVVIPAASSTTPNAVGNAVLQYISNGRRSDGTRIVSAINPGWMSRLMGNRGGVRLTEISTGESVGRLWAEMKGPELIDSLKRQQPQPLPCTRGYSLFSRTESICFAVMEMVGSLPVPTGWTQEDISNDVGLTGFCMVNVHRLVSEFSQAPVELIRKWVRLCPRLSQAAPLWGMMNFNEKIRSLTRFRTTRLRDINRSNVFQETRDRFLRNGIAASLRSGPTEVTFQGEPAMDFGGVTREWYHIVAVQIFDPNTRIFMFTDETRLHMKLRPIDGVIDADTRAEKLLEFEDAGKFLAVMTVNQQLMPQRLELPLIAKLIGVELSWNAINSISRSKCLSMAETTIRRPEDGGMIPYYEELGIPEGDGPEDPVWPYSIEAREKLADIAVTNSMTWDAIEEYEAFSRGFYHVIPRELLVESTIRAKSLQSKMRGTETVDARDLVANLEKIESNQAASGFPQFQYLKQIILRYDQERLRKFLQCVTGNSGVPFGGFSNLEPKLAVKQIYPGNSEMLPVAHTCFNRIDLYPYMSEAQTEERMTTFLDNCAGSMGIA